MNFFRWKNPKDEELDAEIQHHLNEAIRDRIARGETPEEARLNARREFGNVGLVKEVTREMWGWAWLEVLGQDLRFGLRMLRKNPGFTLISVLTLALGIGANLTIFSFVDAFFLRPLPVRDPTALVNVEVSRQGRQASDFNYPGYLHYRDHSQSFAVLAAHYSTAPLQLALDGAARVANGAVVSANYFPLLGIQPALGRFFLPEEDAVPDRNPVVVISHRLWQEGFGGDAAVLGKELRLNGTACRIVGVAPADFSGVLAGFRNEFWLPTMMLRLGYRWCDALTETDCRTLALLGRLAPGRTLPEAEAEMNLLTQQLAATSPDERGRVIALLPAQGVRRDGRKELRYQMQLLMTVTGLLLIIACANVAGLLLMRCAARRKEIAVRLCIGAGRGRLVRQFLTESLLMAGAGGALGLLLSRWARELLAGFYTTTYSSLQLHYDLSLSPRALSYALALTLFTWLLFGLLPALQATRHNLVGALKDEGLSRNPRQHRWRNALVVAQVALSLALLVAAGLLARSAAGVRQGAHFDPQHVAALRLRPALLKYTPQQSQTFVREAVSRLESTAGVQSLTLSSGSGLVWREGDEVRVRLPEQTEPAPEQQLRVASKRIAPRFCETLKIPLLQGREFNATDGADAPRVAFVNETLARRLWPAGAPLTRTLLVNDQPHQIIGVSRDAQLRSAVEAPLPLVYLPYAQGGTNAANDVRLLVRVAGDPQEMLPALRRAVLAVNADMPISEDVPLTQQVDATYKPVLLTSAVLTWSAALAFFLSMLGLYGVLAYAVGERRREIGIRMALGAERRAVLRLIIAQGLRLALIGVALGLTAAYATTRAMKSLLYGVSATDPLIYVALALLLLTVAVVACWLPARRATKVDPLIALRHE